MFLAVRNGRIAERSNDIKTLLRLDSSKYEVFEWNDSLPTWDMDAGEPRPLDPRTVLQKDKDSKEKYIQKRLQRYPLIADQLDMIYWDAINGTTIWLDNITRIKEMFPKSEGEV